MNLESVRAFVAVAEEGQFRHAAARLGISQQAVSKRVAALEDSLGVTLFRRVPTGAALTPDGRTFLPHARAVLVAARQAVESVQRETRPLRVDVLGSRLASTDLLREFHRGHPELPLETVTLTGASAAAQALLDGEIDAAFVHLREPVRDIDSRLDDAPVFLEALEIVVGERHPLAGATSVDLAALAAYEAWMPGIIKGSEWADFYRELADEFGLTIDPTGPDFGIEPLLDVISESRSLITYVGERTRIVWSLHQNLTRIPIVTPTPVYPWSLIWHPGNRHPGLRRLVAHTREHAPRTGLRPSWLPGPSRAAFPR
ncbi:LysR family transcriptional regulator [Streptomyces kanamyceticus]|uniref:LysR family transcriptional regulator n=1 Tax=Streptomyces kanamyceticus TaxID=1967 RepID=A0A5J6GCI4_STRKN|nr:LysR family transcriptional regulator [Streptomyces kanamyceticus]QEU91628.1 LysR family transcriptional regulator [Streptomyces kanamyceticus]